MTHVTRPLRVSLLVAPLLVVGCTLGGLQAPPLENGVYISRGVCFGEGECNRYWRASQSVALHERPDPRSPVITTVSREEWVEAVDGQYRFVPRRGIVHTSTGSPPLAVGDVVYMLEPQGEGFYTLWHRGRTIAHDWAEGDDSEPITWDPDSEPTPDAVLGWWVLLRRENGQSGWIESPQSFECMGSLQGSTGCRD